MSNFNTQPVLAKVTEAEKRTGDILLRMAKMTNSDELFKALEMTVDECEEPKEDQSQSSQNDVQRVQKNLQEELEQTKSALVAATQTIHYLSSVVEQFEDQLGMNPENNFQQALEISEEKREDQNRLFLEKEQENQSLKENLKFMHNFLTELQNSELDSTTKQLNELQIEKKHLERHIDELKKENIKLKETVRDLKRQKKNGRRTLQRTRKANLVMETELKERREQDDAYVNKDNWEDHVEILMNENEKLREEIGAFKGRGLNPIQFGIQDKLRETIQELRQDKMGMEIEFREMKKQIEELQENNLGMGTELKLIGELGAEKLEKVEILENLMDNEEESSGHEDFQVVDSDDEDEYAKYYL